MRRLRPPHRALLRLAATALLAAGLAVAPAAWGQARSAQPVEGNGRTSGSFADGFAESTNALVRTIGQKLAELDAALFAPKQVERFEAIDGTWTCARLYDEVTRLVPASRSYRPGFYDDPANAALAAWGTMWTPAFYFLGVPEYARYREKRHVVNARERITALRAALGDRRCYVD